MAAGKTRLSSLGQTHTLLFIIQGDQMAFYLDGEPAGYGQDAHDGGGSITISINSPTGGSIAVEFENVKFWNLSRLKP